MTRGELKNLVKDVILNEMRVRRTIEPQRVTIAKALQTIRDREAGEVKKKSRSDADAVKAGEIGARPKDSEYYRRQIINIQYRFNQLTDKIKDVESKISQVDDVQNPEESLQRKVELLKTKIQLEIDRLKEAQNFQEVKSEIEKFLNKSKV